MSPYYERDWVRLFVLLLLATIHVAALCCFAKVLIDCWLWTP